MVTVAAKRPRTLPVWIEQNVRLPAGAARAKHDALLVMMKNRPGLSLSGYAEAMAGRSYIAASDVKSRYSVPLLGMVGQFIWDCSQFPSRFSAG
jgi:hypothetical protein